VPSCAPLLLCTTSLDTVRLIVSSVSPTITLIFHASVAAVMTAVNVTVILSFIKPVLLQYKQCVRRIYTYRCKKMLNGHHVDTLLYMLAA